MTFVEPDLRISGNQSGLADFMLDSEINTSMFVQENGGIYDLIALACVEESELIVPRYTVYVKQQEKWLRIKK